MIKTSLPALRAAVIFVGVAALSIPVFAEARGAGGGVRASAPTSIGGGGRVNGANVNRGNVNRGNVNSGNINRGNINTGNINRGNVNIGNDVNINVDRGYNGYWDDRPVARGAAFGAAAAITAAAVGSRIYTLPATCVVYPYRNYTYYRCGTVWYQPQYQGTAVTYVVITDPR